LETNELSNHNASEHRTALAHRFFQTWWALAILVVAHFLFLAFFFGPAISTPDANGYLAQARLIAREGRTDIAVESPAQYVGDHWMPVAEGRYYGQYPPGLPAMLAIVFRPLGPYAALWVIPLMGTLSLVGLYLVVREWVSPAWALLAALLMAVNPFANQHALGADSHTAVCFFLIWALYGLIRWERARSPGWAAFVGICLGVIPTIRYAEALFLFPFGAYVLFSTPRDGRWRRAVLAGLAAAILPLAALAIRNQGAFGAFWRTGYSVSGEQTGFGLGYFVRHAIPYLFMLLTMGVALIFPVGVKGMIELCRRPETRGRGLLLVGLVVPITLLYMAYYWHADSHSMRFLLPTFALYTIAAVWFLRIMGETEPERSRKWARVLLIVTLLWGLPYSAFVLNRLKRDNMALADVSRSIEAHVEPGNILIAQSGLLQHLDFLGDWRLAPEEAFDRQARRSRPVGPRGPRADDPERIVERISPAETTLAVRREIADWAGAERSVYWLTTEARLEEIRDRLESTTDTFTEIAEVELEGPLGPGRGPGGPRRLAGPPDGGDDRPVPPAHFDPPQDGKLVLVRWRIHLEDPGTLPRMLDSQIFPQ
jgi:4-amino-4-deoxy-L-arabinose transferase-like glycosyltransferase